MALKLFFAAALLATSTTLLLASAEEYCIPLVGAFPTLLPGSSPFCKNKEQGAVAWGSYNRTMNETGWNTLTITTNPTVDDVTQAYAAGYFEGVTSYADFVNFHQNMMSAESPFGNMLDIPVLVQFLEANDKYMTTTASKNTSAFWRQIYLLNQQVDGMIAGFAQAANTTGGRVFSRNEVLMSIAFPDMLSDVLPALTQGGEALAAEMRRKSPVRFTHCSSLIALSPDFSDLFFGQSTWMSYLMMTRIFKTVTLNFKQGAVTMQFSSYPGAIASTDDFYMLDSGFFVAETSLTVSNFSLYKEFLVPQAVFSSYRTMAANRLATSGPTWAATFSQHNSGTYNNQWMILDLNLFTPNQDLPANLLTVVEQMPGYVAVNDRTEILSYGFWPSFNIPANREVYTRMGYIPAQDPQFNDYQLNVRGQIFREIGRNVTSIEKLQFIQQYNNYKHDALSQGNPMYAIASRADLLEVEPQAFGEIDTKLSSYKLFMKEKAVMAFSGPTPQQGIFSFSKMNPNVTGGTPRAGMPDTYDFDWQKFTP